MDWNKCSEAILGVEEKVATLKCIPDLFAALIGWAFSFSGVVALFFIIFGGIKVIMSGGDKAAVEEGKKTLTFAVIGLVVIFFSFFIVNLIADLTGATCIKMFGFNACQ